ncbi:MAG TPA: GspH/FimT family pseudopilin [Gemmatimonadales bacterium]|jgi:type IV fimbrial biogenesis protein FimT|nr:GspH/FimT family pseudopilin [Gemmatimonadales bacterium]
MKTTRRKQSGFTLLELLVTLAVSGALFAAGVPSFRTFMANNRRASQTNQLLTALMRARSEAMRSSRDVSVCPSSDGATCVAGTAGWQVGWIVFLNGDGANLASVDAGDELLETFRPIGGTASLRPSGAIRDVIAFRPTGSVVASGSLAWCDDRGATQGRTLTVRPSGGATISEDGAGGGAATCTP